MTAVIICDMWDTHHCRSAAERVAAMAPRVNHVISRLRKHGVLIIHAPGDCTGFYDGTSARLRAKRAPVAPSPHGFEWNERDPAREAELPESLANPGPCSCDSAEPCNTGGRPWTRQIATIGIHSDDAVSDDGQEIFNLLEERGIEEVIVMGVHTNICVLAREYGIRQLVYCGKLPVLCSDLTDSFHRDPRGHAWGTEHTVAHIARHWCPTVTSSELLDEEA